MKAPRLKSLTLEGFRSFVDETEIVFPTNGLVLLAGKNKDTGGSSGSGKSSINLGIAFALGFSPWPSTALTSWIPGHPLKVELVLDTDAGEVRVRRSPNLTVWVDGEQVRGGAKAAEERLSSILGSTPEVLSLLTYRRQRKPGLFLSQTDAEKKELLTKLLDLGKFEAAIDSTQERLKALDSSLSAAEAAVQGTKQVLAEFPTEDSPEELHAQLERDEATLAALEEKRASSVSLRQQLRAEIEREVVEAQNSFSAALAEIRKEQSELTPVPVTKTTTEETERVALIADCQQRIDALVSRDEELRKENKARLQQLTKRANDARDLAAQEEQALKEKAVYERDLSKVDGANCPTCHQKWDGGERHKRELKAAVEAVTGWLEKIHEAKVSLATLTYELEAHPDFVPNPHIVKLRTAKATLEAQLAATRARQEDARKVARAEYEQQLGALREKAALLLAQQSQAVLTVRQAPRPALDLVEKTIAETSLAIQTLSSGLQLTKERLRVAKKTAESIAFWRKKLAEQEKAKAEILAAHVLESDFLALIGREGFLGAIFDEVLDEISDETNAILANIANTKHCTLYFKSESVTQKGTVKKTISPVISVGGQEVSAIESGLSGGMLSAVELAVDLAVGAVVSRRTGVTPGWLILDESFDGLGGVEKETCMEILSKYANDRLVLIVDHHTETKSLFSKSITVSFTNGRSTLA